MMKRMIFFMLLFFLPFHANAEKIEAVIIADTYDGSIGAGIKANQKHIEALLDRLEVEANLTINRTSIDGASFSCKAISDVVDGLNIAENDTVILYYAGHGYRAPDSPSKFPDFDCNRSESEGPALGFSDIVSRLTAKKPRFILAVADTCNVIVAEPAPGVAGGTIGAGVKRKAGLKRLFAGYSGSLLLSGSVPGEPSWYSNGVSPGGFFTSQLLSTINQAISNDGDSASWDAVAQASAAPIYIPRSDPGKTYQHPQFQDVGLQRLP